MALQQILMTSMFTDELYGCARRNKATHLFQRGPGETLAGRPLSRSKHDSKDCCEIPVIKRRRTLPSFETILSFRYFYFLDIGFLWFGFLRFVFFGFFFFCVLRITRREL